jgi:PKD domain
VGRDLDLELSEEEQMAAPTAVAAVMYQSNPRSITFVGSGSIDPDESFQNLSYYWDLGDGTKSTEMNGYHEYDAPGFYIVTLVVVDSFGQWGHDTNVAAFAE